MHLDLSPEQELLRDTVRGLLARHCDLDVVRQLEDDPVGYPEKLWSQLGELGLLGMTIAEEHGSGMSLLDGAVMYAELGRALAPTPHLASSVVSAGVLAAAGTEAQQGEWLPRIAAGDAIVVPAWLEPDGGFGEAGVRLEAAADADGLVLTGTKRHVPFASSADRLLVLARGDTGVVLALIDPNADGVSLTQQMTIASDTQHRVDLDGVRVAAADVLTGGWAAFDAVMEQAIVLLAAQAVGGARFSLEITTQYAKDRKQFDKPLGAFQALAHYLADAATAVDGAEALVWEAAWAAGEGRSIAQLAPMAKLFACSTFRDVTAMAQQIFGGVGFTVEYDIQLYFRRAKQLQITWWGSRFLEERIASALLDA
jgi:alkylation response protein AidB-like acyl-CoA dehydrogenase